MGRMTRAKAAEVAETLHIDEDVLLELEGENENMIDVKPTKEAQVEQNERAPLGELEVNSTDGKSQSDDGSQELRKSTRGKKGSKKGVKGKRNNLAASTASQLEVPDTTTQDQEVLPDENDSEPSPASEKAAEDLLRDIPSGDLPTPSIDDTKPTNTKNKPMKLTRSQLAKFEPESKSSIEGSVQTPEAQSAMKEEKIPVVFQDASQVSINTPSGDVSGDEPMKQTALDAPASPLPNAVPTILAHLRADTPAKRSASNKENIEPQVVDSPQVETLEIPAAAATIATPEPESNTQQPSPAAPADPITALDELDEAVDSVSKNMPNVQTSPEQSKVKRESKKPAPVVRGTKAFQARLSLAQNVEPASKPSSSGKARPSTTPGRSQSVRQSVTTKPEPSARRVASSSASKDAKATATREKKEVVIPHSKPRPVSLSFPAPPPPIKSTKPPTQSTFQLSGDAVAAKLKAAREARTQKEAEDEKKKPAFKARPVPTSLSKAPSIRQTNASKARESIMNGTKPTTTTAAANTSQPRQSLATSTRPLKPSTVPANTAQKRISSAPIKPAPSTSTSTSTAPTTAGAAGTSKGKEVFNRPAAAKAAAEKEKLQKEEAAKKARAEAAERGRLASRQWAEKKKAAGERKKGDAGAAAVGGGNVAAVKVEKVGEVVGGGGEGSDTTTAAPMVAVTVE